AVADWIEADDGALARALLPARARPAVNRVHVGGKQRPIEVSDRPRGGWLADPGGGARPVLAAVDRSPEPSTRACPDRSRIARIDGDPVHLGGRKGKPAIRSIDGWARVQARSGADVDRYRAVRGSQPQDQLRRERDPAPFAARHGARVQPLSAGHQRAPIGGALQAIKEDARQPRRGPAVTGPDLR